MYLFNWLDLLQQLHAYYTSNEGFLHQYFLDFCKKQWNEKNEKA
jgi:hypothetical protein